METELEGRPNSLLEGLRDLRKRLRESKRKREEAMERDESLVRKIDGSEGMAIEATENRVKNQGQGRQRD